MSWTCRMIESRDKEREEKGSIAVGSMWYAPHMLEGNRPEMFGLSQRYLTEIKPKRPPLIVKLPDHTEFCVDVRAWDTVAAPCDHKVNDEQRTPDKCPYCGGTGTKKVGRHYGEGWLVTGTEPLITLSPSINIVGSYHGWIQNGIITDDCEGRKYALV
jgi:hypothetical protein